MTALLAVLPWLGLAPLPGALGVLAHAALLIAACHGAGRVVAWHRPAPAALVISWGLAALLTLAGILLVLGLATARGLLVLELAGAALHSAAVLLRGRRAALPLHAIGVGALLAALAALAILGAAGDGFAQPFDDEANLVAQLHRLLATGGLGDALGYPRHAGLGAQVALAALAAAPGISLGSAVEPLAMLLALAITAQWLAPRTPSGALWAALVITGAFALALAPFDPLPWWTGAALLVATFRTLDIAADATADPPLVPLALLAGAMIALRLELAPIAAAALVLAWRRAPRDPRRAALLVGVAVLAVAPYALARALAAHHVAAALAPRGPKLAFPLRLAITAAIAAPLSLLLRLALPSHAQLRGFAIATALGLAGCIAHLFVAGPYSLRLGLAIALGFALALIAVVARDAAPRPAALVLALALVVGIFEGTRASGRVHWSRRAAAAALAIDALELPASDPYRAVLATARPGARIATWVGSPERLDHARFRFFDLRTPGGSALRGHDDRLATLLAALRADYLLVETDAFPALARPRVVAERDGVQLVELSSGSPLRARTR